MSSNKQLGLFSGLFTSEATPSSDVATKPANSDDVLPRFMLGSPRPRQAQSLLHRKALIQWHYALEDVGRDEKSEAGHILGIQRQTSI